ncbi:uncharacterized protein N0V89_003685 [Didymosphaeria variabile]|uniref:Nucleotide-diphospho-sugar transferase n=1 Tax=Didymosphaeria variabile TaxID=1932322 RepID=A0A9W8XN33_9PLEO|nr:uncharacterized protein N0V89_003685 [Didymosphaeria variabile]KAJ4355665.1 hypothetical protein N0V89_003685 [Didymosphaeria variabile]
MIFKFRLFFVVVLTALLGITWCLRAASHDRQPYLGSSYRGYNSTAHLPATDHAIATFLTGQATDDSYFTATRILTHQLLHAESTRCNSNATTFIVLCSESVPKEQKDTLREDGATVVEVRDVPLNWWIRSGEARWKEQFNKLRVFEMTEYKRILFLDPDTMLTGPVDPIFDEPEVVTLTPTLLRKDQVKWGESQLPSHWLFAARSDNGLTGQREHPTPPLQTKSFNAGFFLVAPDRQIYKHLVSVMALVGRFDTYTMEQGLLNYVFRREGLMPWRELHWKWSATWPNEQDLEMEVVALHDQSWKTGPQQLRDMWNARKGEMLNFHDKRRLAAV